MYLKYIFVEDAKLVRGHKYRLSAQILPKCYFPIAMAIPTPTPSFKGVYSQTSGQIGSRDRNLNFSVSRRQNLLISFLT